MRTVGLVARQRLARHWRSLGVAGVLLGLGFGLCFACFAAARSTVSAYDRVLAAADAPDAAVALGLEPQKDEAALSSIKGVTSQRVYAGFLGTADGVDPVLATVLIAPIRDRFPLELPLMHDGRLPNPDAPDEVFVNNLVARRGGIGVGDRLHFRFVNPYTNVKREADVRVTGVGSVPSEAVADETGVLGVWVFTRAFFDANVDLVSYAASNVDLAPGFDARRDLAGAVTKRGYELQSARGQEQQAVIEALRPLTIVIVALGVLAFGATAVGAGQVVQRSRDRWRTANVTLHTLGMTGGQIRGVEFLVSGVLAAIVLGVALLTMYVASPAAPIGPLHDFDPAQGYHLDATVAMLGAAAIVLTIALLTLGFSSVRRRVGRPTPARASWITSSAQGPATLAGLTLALRADDGRRRARRAFAAPTVAAAVLALSAAFVASAITLTDSPARYGFDADLVAVNAYGDQAPKDLARVFAGRDDVVAATGYTAASYLVFGHAVPGIAATRVKGEPTPTILRGRGPRGADEIVLGKDTLAMIGARLSDVVGVQALRRAGARREAGPRVPLRIVGVATFPSINQVGSDMPRLGVGALVTREAFVRMVGDDGNQPEFTTLRLADGTDPRTVIAANRTGFHDVAQSTTSWFTDAKPAELLQLDAALPYLRGALAVGYAVLLAVMIHALWTRARANRRPLAVLRAMGCTRGQLDAVTAWQVAPYTLGAILIGTPIGLILGNGAYRRFAQSLAVVDDPTTSLPLLAALLGAIVLAAAIAGGVAIFVARRSRTATDLREG